MNDPPSVVPCGESAEPVDDPMPREIRASGVGDPTDLPCGVRTARQKGKLSVGDNVPPGDTAENTVHAVPEGHLPGWVPGLRHTGDFHRGRLFVEGLSVSPSLR